MPMVVVIIMTAWLLTRVPIFGSDLVLALTSKWRYAHLFDTGKSAGIENPNDNTNPTFSIGSDNHGSLGVFDLMSLHVRTDELDIHCAIPNVYCTFAGNLHNQIGLFLRHGL